MVLTKRPPAASSLGCSVGATRGGADSGANQESRWQEPHPATDSPSLRPHSSFERRFDPASESPICVRVSSPAGSGYVEALTPRRPRTRMLRRFERPGLAGGAAGPFSAF